MKNNNRDDAGNRSVESKTSTSSRKLKSNAESDVNGVLLNRTENGGFLGRRPAINFSEDTYPIENEEWIVFLQKTIEEVMNGEMTSLSQPNLANIVVSPLRNCNCSSKVVTLASSLLSLPFVANETSEDCLQKIKNVIVFLAFSLFSLVYFQTYLEVKLIPNLVNAGKLVMKQKNAIDSTGSSSTESPITSFGYKSLNDLNDDDLKALEYTYLLICHLVHLNDQFLTQFCDAVVVLNIYGLLQKLLLLCKSSALLQSLY